MEIQVHETAFIIALYRARNEAESMDPYARLWVRKGLEKWADAFAVNVSPYDELLHCMRNRLIHERLLSLNQKFHNLCCINLGAGFSMYPYSQSESMETIEVDFEAVVRYKSDNIEKFTQSDELPSRSVQHLAGSITNSYDQLKITEAVSNFKGRPKVIIIEGVFFFLDTEEIRNCLSLCRQILEPGDMLLCNSFREEIADTEVWRRLMNYFSEELQSEGHATFLPHSFYDELPEFRLLERTSTLELAQELGLMSPEIDESEVLNEYLYVLQKQ